MGSQRIPTGAGDRDKRMSGEGVWRMSMGSVGDRTEQKERPRQVACYATELVMELEDWAWRKGESHEDLL